MYVFEIIKTLTFILGMCLKYWDKNSFDDASCLLITRPTSEAALEKCVVSLGFVTIIRFTLWKKLIGVVL